MPRGASVFKVSTHGGLAHADWVCCPAYGASRHSISRSPTIPQTNNVRQPALLSKFSQDSTATGRSTAADAGAQDSDGDVGQLGKPVAALATNDASQHAGAIRPGRRVTRPSLPSLREKLRAHTMQTLRTAHHAHAGGARCMLRGQRRAQLFPFPTSSHARRPLHLGPKPPSIRAAA